MPQLTVPPTESSTQTTPDLNVRYTVTPRGRATLAAESAPLDRFLPEAMFGMDPRDYAECYLTGWHARLEGLGMKACPWWGGPKEGAFEDGLRDAERDPSQPWTTPLFGLMRALETEISAEEYREALGVETPDDRAKRRAYRVAVKVRHQLDRHHVTVAEVCRRTGIPRSTMNRKLNGTTPFKVSDLWDISNALGATFMDLVPAEEVSR